MICPLCGPAPAYLFDSTGCGVCSECLKALRDIGESPRTPQELAPTMLRMGFSLTETGRKMNIDARTVKKWARKAMK